MTKENSKMKYFSEDDQSIGAECLECGRVIKVKKNKVVKRESMLLIRGGITCICGVSHTEIDMVGNRRNTLAETEVSRGGTPSQIACPKCGSKQFNSSNKGFGLGKAAGGFALLGPLGLFGGLIGSKKVYITCLKCGNKWRAGK